MSHAFVPNIIEDVAFLNRLVEGGRARESAQYPQIVARVLVHHMANQNLARDFETLARAAAPHASCCAAFGRLAVPTLMYQLEYRSAADIEKRVGSLEQVIPAACDTLIPTAANGLIENAMGQEWTAYTPTAYHTVELLRALQGTRHLDNVRPDLLEKFARCVVTQMTYLNDSPELLQTIAQQRPTHKNAIETGLREGYTQLQQGGGAVASQHGRLGRIAPCLT